MLCARKSLQTATGLFACMAVMLAACSSHEPKPLPQPTPDQVRGHADRGFDNLKKEEQERGVQTNVPH